MSTLRAGDLYLFMTEDGGEISVKNGEPVMDGGFETAVNISLFESNQSDHWMNEYMSEDEKITGKFQSFIQRTSRTASNMRKAEEYAKMDLNWMKNCGAADEIEAEMISVNPNKVNLTINILAEGKTIFNRIYGINWLYQQQNQASKRI